jgi:DNA-binding SARP family transcriptional activator
MAAATRSPSGRSSRQEIATAPDLRFEVLGPVRAWSNGTELDLGSPQQRAVLAILLLAQGRQVSRDMVIDAIWGEDPPRGAAGTIRTYVSRLRHCLGTVAGNRATGLLTSVGNGYAFETGAVTVDVELFTRQVQQAQLTRRRGDRALAASQLNGALGLWRGMPLAGIQGPYAESQRARLLELRMAALEERLATDIESGGHRAAIAELRALLDENPLREKLSELLMLALYRAGRQADALAVFGDSRRLLRGELGIDPGPGLRDMHERILRADGSLAEGLTARLAGSPAQLPPPPAELAGRGDTLSAIVEALRDSPAAPVIAITGMPGIGKSALALQAAHAVSAVFPDGQLYAELGDADGAPGDPGAVLAGFHQVLGNGVRPDPPEEPRLAFRAALAGRRVLVVLEGVSSTAQAGRLLDALRGCAVIITAQRRMIGLPGVRWFEIGPLVPGEAMHLLERLVGPARIAAERAAAEKVITACAGQPIAVRTAAARLVARPTWGIAAMAGALEEELRLPVLSHPDCKLVEAPFERAYRLLPNDQAFVFRQAAMSDGPEISAAAVGALTEMLESRALATLESVADVHLLQAGALGSYRYDPLVKLYAWRKALAEDGHQTCEASRELLRRASGRPLLVP